MTADEFEMYFALRVAFGDRRHARITADALPTGRKVWYVYEFLYSPPLPPELDDFPGRDRGITVITPAPPLRKPWWFGFSAAVPDRPVGIHHLALRYYVRWEHGYELRINRYNAGIIARQMRRHFIENMHKSPPTITQEEAPWAS